MQNLPKAGGARSGKKIPGAPRGSAERRGLDQDGDSGHFGYQPVQALGVYAVLGHHIDPLADQGVPSRERASSISVSVLSQTS